MRVPTHRGRHHHRQPLGEVAQHLEAGRAGAEDDGGLQHGGRHAAARAGSRRPRGGSPGAPRAGRPGAGRRGRRSGARPQSRAASATIVAARRSIAAKSRSTSEWTRKYTTSTPTQARRTASSSSRSPRTTSASAGPRHVAQLRGVADEAAHGVALGEQPGGQASADVAGGAGDEVSHTTMLPCGRRLGMSTAGVHPSCRDDPAGGPRSGTARTPAVIGRVTAAADPGVVRAPTPTVRWGSTRLIRPIRRQPSPSPVTVASDSFPRAGVAVMGGESADGTGGERVGAIEDVGRCPEPMDPDSRGP